MSPLWTVHACLVLGLLSALVAGVFQAFSDFVMAGLVRARPESGIEVMQHINRTVFRSVFLASFLALVPLSIGFAAYAWFHLEGPGRALILAAAAIYGMSSFLVTVAGNVPMNERLARLDPATPEAAQYWQTYGRLWTRWNHVRTIGSLGSAVCLVLAAVTLAGS